MDRLSEVFEKYLTQISLCSLLLKFAKIESPIKTVSKVRFEQLETNSSCLDNHSNFDLLVGMHVVGYISQK